MTKTSTYQIWKGMIRRCHDASNPGYRSYGERGIKVCERWRECFDNFFADMGVRPDGMSIERTNNDGDYEPGNCIWADAQAQGRNRRTNRHLEHGGERLTISEWAQRTGIAYPTLVSRVNLGWDSERALTTPSPRRTKQ